MSEANRKPARQYTAEYKAEAVKLVQEIGNGQAAIEPGGSAEHTKPWGVSGKNRRDRHGGRETNAAGGDDTGSRDTKAPSRKLLLNLLPRRKG